MIGHYLDHQMEVIERRTRFRLAEAEARAHLVEGLIIAVDNIDEVVALIRGSSDTAEARTRLMERFELSEIQANAILDMPLRRLTALEVNKLREELAELMRTITELKAILADPALRRSIIRADLTEIKEKFATPRRSQIVLDEGEMSLEDLIADDELIVTVSASGYVKSVPASTYKTQGRGDGASRPPRCRVKTSSRIWSTPLLTPTCCSSPTRVLFTGPRPTRFPGRTEPPRECSPRRCSRCNRKSASRRSSTPATTRPRDSW